MCFCCANRQFHIIQLTGGTVSNADKGIKTSKEEVEDFTVCVAEYSHRLWLAVFESSIFDAIANADDENLLFSPRGWLKWNRGVLLRKMGAPL